MKLSPEQRLKISEATKKGMANPEVRKKISEAKKGCTPWMKGKKHSVETKIKMSEWRIGKFGAEKCHLWRGGVTSINHKIRNSTEYKQWRKAVFERDGYTCQKCGAKSGNGRSVVLNADHIKPFAVFPNLRFELTNGRTLCKKCHLKTDTIGKRYKDMVKLYSPELVNKI